MKASAGLFRLLGDEVRLRVLRLLAAEALNVTELTGIVGIAQSGVSRHLGLLRDAGLVAEERSGGYTWFRLNPAVKEDENGHGGLWPMLQAQFHQASDPVLRADDAKLQEVLRLRKESFAEHGAAEDARQLVPGRSWPAWARAISYLLPPSDVADLGCGDGYLTIEAARWAKKVVGVDRSPEMLRLARAKLAEAGLSSAELRQGDMYSLPLASGSADTVILHQVLHYAQQPAAAVAEAARLLAPGGRLLIVDFAPHEREELRLRDAHLRLGFADVVMLKYLDYAGLRGRVVEHLEGGELTVTLWQGERPQEKLKVVA